MIRELKILTILAVITLLLFSGWRLLEQTSVLSEQTFLNRRVERINPNFNLELLPNP